MTDHKLIVIALAVLILLPGGAAAQTAGGPIDLQVQPGFDGLCRENSWMPVWVTVENQGRAFLANILVEISPAGEDTDHVARINLPASSRKRIVIPVFVDGFASTVSVTVADGNETMARISSRLTCVTAADGLFGVVSDEPSTFNSILDVSLPSGRVYLAAMRLNELPSQPQLLSGLDGILLSDTDTSSLTSEQQTALSQWIAHGKLLLLASGPASQSLGDPLSAMAGIELTGESASGGNTGLETFAQIPIPIEGDLILRRIKPDAGTNVLLSDNEIPILTERRIGLGSVVFLAVDPLAASLRNWPGMRDFYAQLLKLPAEQPGWGQGFTDWDMASQAAASLPGRALPPLTLICGLLLLYVLAVGPLNFALLRRVRRLELAWFTTPALVLIFSLMTYLIGNSIRGSQPVLNKLAVVQTWIGTPQATVDGLIGVFSPRRSRYRIITGPGLIPFPLPRQSTSNADSLIVLQTEAGFEVPELRVDVAETSPVAVTGTIPAPAVTHRLALTADPGATQLRGEIVNGSALTFEDLVIVLGDQVAAIGDLSPAGTLAVDIRFDRSLPAAPDTAFGLPGPNIAMVEAIAGADFSIRSSEDETARRFGLINALLGTFQGRASYHPGIFLMAWTPDTPLEIELSDTGFETTAISLYIFQLEAALEAPGGPQTVPPSFFQWKLGKDSLSRDFAAYRTSLEAGASVQMEFSLIYPLNYRRVEALTLNLSAYQQTGTAPLEFWLWNREAEDWDPIDSPLWGPNSIRSPQLYIGPGGVILLRVDNPDLRRNVPVERIDFSMVVAP